ncbi:hypothetical protein CDL15_Pgr018222 [Punica granatum]|uniref:Uncharacterized protein n=1 Tax=Punica granatum TaxID=22663 RepID=A0A218WHN1_PUNGR|nr:hypothetical protein CDL15_Pgr018222 [Punica granatum]
MGEPSVDWEMQEHCPYEQDSGKVSWILKKGLVLGKNILVTGVVVSSAPIVLPLLLGISAFGFAVSVPSGLFLASYACSEKLMSKLLPGPSPSTFPLDCGGATYNEEVEEYGVGFKGDFDMEEEEVEQFEDTRGVAMRLELPVEDVGRRFEKVGSDLVTRDLSEIVEEDAQQNAGGLIDDQVQPLIEGHAGGRRDKIQDLPVNEMKGIVLTVEADDRTTLEDKGTSFEVREVVVMESAGAENIEEGKLAKETTGLIEKLRDEGRDDRREQHEVIDETALEEHETETGKNAEDVGTQVEAKDAGRKGKKKGKKKGKVEEKSAMELPKQNEKNNESKSSVGDTTEVEKPMKDAARSDLRTSEDSRLWTGKGQHSGRVVNGSEKSSGIHPVKGTNLPSQERTDGNEKIWKQIEALWVMVGYKATQQATCLEELKALYLFTGVEPPESFKDISDQDELNDKLRFLMSIVGVK